MPLLQCPRPPPGTPDLRARNLRSRHCPAVARRVRCGCRGVSLRRSRRPRCWSPWERDRPAAGAAYRAAPLCHYTSPDEDSARWWDFPFRAGRHRGEHPVQVGHHLGADDLPPARLRRPPSCPITSAELSPWLDWLVRPKEDVFARPGRADAPSRHQDPHPARRRPARRRAPPTSSSDATRSTWPSRSITTATTSIAAAWPSSPGDPKPTARRRPPLHEWLVGFIDWEGDPRELARHPARGDAPPLRRLGPPRTRPTSCWCTTTTSSRTSTAPCARLAGRLGIPVDEERWPAFVQAATFESMRAGAPPRPTPDCGVLKDPAAFFRQGSLGRGSGAPERPARWPTTATAWRPWPRRDLLAWLAARPSED